MGKDALIFLSDQYGSRYQFSYALNTDLATGFLMENEYLPAEKIQGIWNRKYAAPYSFQATMSQENAPWLREAHLLLFGFLNATDIFCLDRLEDAINAENKLLQLKLAKEAGMAIPPTLFSNQPEDIFRFLEIHQDQVVAKMQGVLTWSMEGSTDFFYTKKISRADLQQSNILSVYPLIYQKLIEKEYELRVIYVDGQCFCGKIPSLSPEIVDWRQPGVSFSWEKSQLPAEICSKLQVLMDRLHLKFGAIDIIKSVDGQYYFLEVNPTGEWGMLQRDVDLPIAENLAKTLVKYGT